MLIKLAELPNHQLQPTCHSLRSRYAAELERWISKTMRPLTVLLLVSATAACVPYPLQETPRIYGRVISATTQEPVSGAALQYQEHPGKVVQTKVDGSFEFPSISKWQLVPLAPYDHFYNNTLVVTAPSYEPATVKVGIYSEGEKIITIRSTTPQ